MPMPTKRGRPATGQAMSNAERQRKFREAHKAENNRGVKAKYDAARMLIESLARQAENHRSASNVIGCYQRAAGAADLYSILVGEDDSLRALANDILKLTEKKPVW